MCYWPRDIEELKRIIFSLRNYIYIYIYIFSHVLKSSDKPLYLISDNKKKSYLISTMSQEKLVILSIKKRDVRKT
jgi:hypothetical protein